MSYVVGQRCKKNAPKSKSVCKQRMFLLMSGMDGPGPGNRMLIIQHNTY